MKKAKASTRPPVPRTVRPIPPLVARNCSVSLSIFIVVPFKIRNVVDELLLFLLLLVVALARAGNSALEEKQEQLPR